MPRTYFSKHIIFFALLAFTLSSAFITSNVSACTDNDNAGSFVEDLKSQIFSIVEKNEDIEKSLESMANGVIDWKQMAKFVMGSHWKKATEQQKTQFIDVYGQFIRKVYVTQLRMYAHYSMKVMSVRSSNDSEYAVKVRMVSPEQRDDFIILEFYLMCDNSFKIIDIRLNNSVSIAVNHRAFVDDLVEQSGIDGVISYYELAINT